MISVDTKATFRKCLQHVLAQRPRTLSGNMGVELKTLPLRLENVLMRIFDIKPTSAIRISIKIT